MIRLQRIFKGCAAGLAGAAAMHLYRVGWERFVRNDVRHTIFGFDIEADRNATHLLSAALSVTVRSEETAEKIGIQLHYLFGLLLGAAYEAAAMRGHVVLQAMVLWLIADEIPIALTGISKPSSKSAASHAGALTAHLVFLMTVEAILLKGAGYTKEKR